MTTTDELQQLLELQCTVLANTRAAMRAGHLDEANRLLVTAKDLLRQYAELTGRHIEELGPGDLDGGPPYDVGQ